MDVVTGNTKSESSSKVSRLESVLIATSSVVRRLPLFFRNYPGTPLRVLCIVAFDVLHKIRTSKWLPDARVRELALMLDYGAFANAASDHKSFCSRKHRCVREQLDAADLGAAADDYWQQIHELEKRRPSVHCTGPNSQHVRIYREDVVRLSLGALTAIAFNLRSIEEGTRSVLDRDDMNVIFRIVMLCQIIDDLFDYSKDLAAGLPGFLTASPSLPKAFEITCQARLDYAGKARTSDLPQMFCFEIVLRGLSASAGVLTTLGRWRQRVPRLNSSVQGVAGSL